MTPFQWALIVVGIGAAIAVWWSTQRGRDSGVGPGVGERMKGAGPQMGVTPREKQLDMFNATGQFDEFGVGRARRVAPSLDGAPTASQASRPQVQQKIIALLIAERDGTHIYGTKVHAALAANNLQFGEKQIYHRLVQGDPIYSVASLLKPGYLDPALAPNFSTPGLSIFMVLPGPLPPVTAFREMMQTAQNLAKALNSEVFDMRRKPLTPESLLKLEFEVEGWARSNPGA